MAHSQPSKGSAAEHDAARRNCFVEQSQRGSFAPLREFWLTRVRVPMAFFRGGRAPVGAEDGVGRFGRFRKVPRLVSLSEGSLLEKGTNGKDVSRHHDLQCVAAIVVFELACESRCFAVEWSDASVPTVYETNRRQRDVALLLEQAQAAKQAAVPVLPDFTWVRPTATLLAVISLAILLHLAVLPVLAGICRAFPGALPLAVLPLTLPLQPSDQRRVQ